MVYCVAIHSILSLLFILIYWYSTDNTIMLFVSPQKYFNPSKWK